ncbi:MAG: toll/interleukin-1 receptor domain-containing protein [Desulfobacter sp.]|nr:MAG: toll/interleukin-1 receptor domain-containing protein [Desulfobacter sp.]
MSQQDQLRTLISKQDNIEAAIDALYPLLGGEEEKLLLDNWGAQLAAGREDWRAGIIGNGEYSQTRARIRMAVLKMISEISPSDHSVFISYSHKDRRTAAMIADELKKEGISVVIDSEALDEGGNIKGFILDAIKKTDVTLSLVSNSSLMSAWVCLETVHSFDRALFDDGKRIIACYIDDDFFRPGFQIELTGKIDKKLAEIDGYIRDALEQGLDFASLNQNRSRLLDLKHHLGRILNALQEHKCLDLKPDSGNGGSLEQDRFKDKIRPLIRAIKAQAAF